MTHPAMTRREWWLPHNHLSETNNWMHVKTILKRIQKQRGFVYGTVQLEEQIAGLTLTVDIALHRRNRPQCSWCGHRGGVYDRGPAPWRPKTSSAVACRSGRHAL